MSSAECLWSFKEHVKTGNYSYFQRSTKTDEQADFQWKKTQMGGEKPIPMLIRLNYTVAGFPIFLMSLDVLSIFFITLKCSVIIIIRILFNK